MLVCTQPTRIDSNSGKTGLDTHSMCIRFRLVFKGSGSSVLFGLLVECSSAVVLKDSAKRIIKEEKRNKL